MAPITVGIPTYKRPEGLRRALWSLSQQSLTPNEILISDNDAEGNVNDQIANEFPCLAANIRYVRQKENIGASQNFDWLLQNASQPYFIWLADDDEYADGSCLENLYKASVAENLFLAFPDVNVFYDSAKTQWSRNIHTKVFGRCVSDWDYLKAFASYGGGHSYYGLYNTEKLRRLDPKKYLDPHLVYFSEGRFLHEIFIQGGARFVNKAKFNYDGTAAGKIDNYKLYLAFREYSESVFELYYRSDLPIFRKAEIIIRIMIVHFPYIRVLRRRIN